MGYRYGMANAVPNPIAVDPATLRAEPGTRAPHVWLEKNGARCSTRDLFGNSAVLLAGAQAAEWADTVASTTSGILVLVIGRDLADQDERFLSTYGLTARGAVLVRDDGIVVWKMAWVTDEDRLTLAEACRWDETCARVADFT